METNEEDTNMERMIMNMDMFFAPNIKLGSFSGENKYRVSRNCQAKLEEILDRLKQDKSRWHFRRSLFMNKVISQNLLPNLIYAKGDCQLLGTTIKVLQELMTPVECLMPVETMCQSGEGQRIIIELEKAISSSKKLFLDTRITKALVDFVDSILQQKTMSISDCEMVNHCLVLVRNLFHVQPIFSSTSEDKSSTDEECHRKKMKTETFSFTNSTNTSESTSCHSSSQSSSSTKESTLTVLTEDQIMWNLFAQRFDNIIIKLLTCQQQHLWNITMVQLVSLMYREQQQGTIRKLINEWLELSLCESSTDDENNTLSSSSYDAVSTSDPVSDFSERLSPIEGARCSKTKNTIPATEINDKNSSLSSQSINENSSKDSGIGRSCSNNEGETSVDESIQDFSWSQNNEKFASNNESIELGFAYSSKDEKLNQNSDGSLQNLEKQGNHECLEMNLTLFDKTIADIRCVFDDEGESGFEETEVKNSESNENQTLEINMKDNFKTEAIDNENDNIAVVKKPPNENESYSGDSSEKPPPHPLPKVKGKVLLPGPKRSRHCMSQKMMNDVQDIQDLSNSTCSDCDEGPNTKRPHHQKPLKMLIKPRPSKLVQRALHERNMKRNKLLKRKETRGIKAKALLHHQPSPEDISNILKEFTIDFMLNGYATLLQGLRMQVLLPYQMDLDKSHLLWLITYFLRFAVELDLELGQICPVLSVEVVSYLVYEGVVMQEELEIALKNGESNLTPHVRRLHLVVTALREFFISFELCLKKDPSSFDARNLTTTRDDLSRLVELRQIFLFLIRMYRPGILSINYLQDLITTNNKFMLILEGGSYANNSFDMIAHIKQFATMDIMRQYGRVLENFDVNEELVNDSIFTMMHHISGELRVVNVLLQPSILKTFLRIWKEGFELCADWSDLIEYVLRKCAKRRTNGQENLLDSINFGEAQEIQLTAEDLDQLYTLYSTFNEQDLMEKIKDVCCDDSIEEPIKKEVIQKLLARGYISSTECSKLCAEISQTETISKNKRTSKRSHHDIDKIYYVEDSLFFNGHLPSSRHFENLIISEKFVASNKMHYYPNSDSKRFCSNEEESHPESNSCFAADMDSKVDGTNSRINENNLDNNFLTDANSKDEDNEGWEEEAVIAQLIDQVRAVGMESYIKWIQSELLEACYAKLKLLSPVLPLPEPLFFHFAISNQSLPIIPWTNDQEDALSFHSVQQLLSVLGLHLPEESGKLYPRIPQFWGPDLLHEVAKKLGPIDQGTLKFSLKLMTEVIEQLKPLTHPNVLRYTSFDDRCDEICGFNSSMDCDDSPERLSDCSMHNNRSTSASPVSSLEDSFPPTHFDSQLLNASQKLEPFAFNEPESMDDKTCETKDSIGFEKLKSCAPESYGQLETLELKLS